MQVAELGAEKRVRVCHMIGSLQIGGAERQFVNLLNHLPDCERHAFFLSGQDESGLFPLLDETITTKWFGVRLRAAPKHIYCIAQGLRRCRIDVLHTHMYWASFYGALAARLARVPVLVTTEHGRNSWKRPWHRWIERRLITPWTDRRICVSQDILAVRRDQDRIAPEKLIVIPNGVELPRFARWANKDCVVIGTLGRFVDAKDYMTMIRAAACLRARAPDFRLYILGDGPERGAMEAEIRRLGLQGHVEMPGFQADVAGWLRRFDIFAMSSIREGQPMALLEAMSHGLPIVATTVGGIPETVESNTEGILVPPGDPERLAEALLMLMSDPALRNAMGAAARARIERDYAIGRIAEMYRDLYDHLLKAKHHVATA